MTIFIIHCWRHFLRDVASSRLGIRTRKRTCERALIIRLFGFFLIPFVANLFFLFNRLIFRFVIINGPCLVAKENYSVILSINKKRKTIEQRTKRESLSKTASLGNPQVIWFRIFYVMLPFRVLLYANYRNNEGERQLRIAQDATH